MLKSRSQKLIDFPISQDSYGFHEFREWKLAEQAYLYPGLSCAAECWPSSASYAALSNDAMLTF